MSVCVTAIIRKYSWNAYRFSTNYISCPECALIDYTFIYSVVVCSAIFLAHSYDIVGRKRICTVLRIRIII